MRIRGSKLRGTIRVATSEVGGGAGHAFEGQGAWFRSERGVKVGNSPQRVGVQRWEGGGAGHAFEAAESLVSDPREGQSWEFISEGRGSEVGVGGWACVREGRELGFGSVRGVKVWNSSQRVGLRRWEWGAGHAFEGAGSLVSDPRGGSELGIHHRG